MSRDGTGTYSLPAGNPVVTLTAISSAWANSTLSDIGAELTNSIDKAGRTVPTANLPMGGFKHTGAAAPNANGDYLVWGSAGTLSSLTATGNATAAALIPSGATVPANGLYLPAANTVGLASNTTLRWSVNSAGSHVFAAPSSGVAVTVTGAGTSPILDLSGTTVGTFVRVSRSGTTVGDIGSGDSIVSGGTATSFGINSRVGHDLILGAGNNTAVTITPARNVTIAAPSSGVGFTGTGVAGSDAFVYNGGTSGSFRVNTTGVPYGTSLHNNAGAVTGTTNQYITSGTYTPAGTVGANCDAITPSLAQWIRVGNVVTVSGQVDLDPTAGGAVAARMSLPIASAFTSTIQGCGVGISFDAIAKLATVTATAATDDITIGYAASAGTASTFQYTFTYVIV